MIELKIVVGDDGRMQVSGPLDNPVQCYGLLEMAKDTIRAHMQSQANRTIVPANGATLQLLDRHHQ